MVVFDEHQVIALRIDHLPAEIALAEYGIAGDQTPLEDQTLEQSKGGFVLVGLLLTAVGDSCLGQCQARFMSQQREQVHGLLEAVEASSGRLAVQGVGLRQ